MGSLLWNLSNKSKTIVIFTFITNRARFIFGNKIKHSKCLSLFIHKRNLCNYNDVRHHSTWSSQIATKRAQKQKRRIIAPPVFCQYSQRYSKDYYISKYPIISTTFSLITNVALEKASTRKTAFHLLSRLGKQPTKRERPLAHC